MARCQRQKGQSQERKAIGCLSPGGGACTSQKRCECEAEKDGAMRDINKKKRNRDRDGVRVRVGEVGVRRERGERPGDEDGDEKVRVKINAKVEVGERGGEVMEGGGGDDQVADGREREQDTLDKVISEATTDRTGKMDQIRSSVSSRRAEIPSHLTSALACRAQPVA